MCAGTRDYPLGNHTFRQTLLCMVPVARAPSKELKFLSQDPNPYVTYNEHTNSWIHGLMDGEPAAGKTLLSCGWSLHCADLRVSHVSHVLSIQLFNCSTCQLFNFSTAQLGHFSTVHLFNIWEVSTVQILYVVNLSTFKLSMFSTYQLL